MDSPRPREHALERGVAALTDGSLVATLLGTGLAGEPVEQLAERLLADFGGLRGLEQASLRQLTATRGLGPSKAVRLAAALELGRRARTPGKPQAIRSPEDVDALLGPRLIHADVEHFIGLALDARMRLVEELWLAKGGLTACPVHTRDVFRAVLRAGVPCVVFVHNHPSGDPTPSDDDIALTETLRRAGDLLGVHVVDHVVVARGGVRSLLRGAP